MAGYTYLRAFLPYADQPARYAGFMLGNDSTSAEALLFNRMGYGIDVILVNPEDITFKVVETYEPYELGSFGINFNA